MREWSRRTITPDTWESFTRFRRNTIADPVNRIRLKKAEQRQGQSVREFANYVEELEEDIPEMGIEESRAWILLIFAPNRLQNTHQAHQTIGLTRHRASFWVGLGLV